LKCDPPGTLSQPLVARLGRALEARSDRWCHPALSHCVPHLVELVLERGGQPTAQWSGNVRRLLEESLQPVSESSTVPLGPEAVDELLDVVVRKLDQLRRITHRGNLVLAEPSHWFG